MSTEIGIVCAKCEAFGALDASTCASCGSSLALESAPASAPAARAASAAPSAAAPPSGTSNEGPKTTRNPVPPSGGGAIPPSRPEVASRPSVQRAAAAYAVHNRADPRAEGPVRERLASFTDEVAPTSVRLSPGTGSAPPSRPRASSPDSAPISSAGRTKSQRSLPTPISQKSAAQSIEELMDQAKNFVCRSCSTPVPLGHKFCGRCGAALPPEIMSARTQFFGQLQAPGKAKLILIRGEGVEGLSYQLNADQHVVGRTGQLVFPDDPFVSPQHANFFYRDGKLVVRDEGSLNGVYVRVRGSVDITFGDFLLAGEQVFRVDAPPKVDDQAIQDGTYYYASPRHKSPFRVVQALQGGADGMTVCARGPSLQIGREGGDLNFPGDLYMSATHCRIEESGGRLTLSDLSSRNGTYVRLKAERELSHGDYLFIGRKLLRVEITAA
ncbi:MAG: FHA domain-containing protein [Myxococcales bacterium]|nr:FHA domain-containing protein [Myxococcales bacterium]